MTSSRRFTFRGNLGATRHGWLRLTPAYSVHFVRELLSTLDAAPGPVLDPFCGTGTTLLACAERGLDCATVDLNPFLVWLARAKTASYRNQDIDGARVAVENMYVAAGVRSAASFVPEMHRIDRWWDGPVLAALGRAAGTARELEASLSPRSRDLVSLALCRTVIDVANVSFGHQSMSFRKTQGGVTRGTERVQRALRSAFETLSDAAGDPLKKSRRKIHQGDSRAVHEVVEGARFGAVVTSPPYSNRMSYIRELRPYMYWLGYLTDRTGAGDLDWRAIGGTWGSATSRLASWRPDPKVEIPFRDFGKIVERISERQPILGAYVHRYFEDMVLHARSVSRIVAPGARLHYVLGNSKFYDVLLPAEKIFAALFDAVGFRDVRIVTLRKRTSKPELYEYLVRATA